MGLLVLSDGCAESNMVGASVAPTCGAAVGLSVGSSLGVELGCGPAPVGWTDTVGESVSKLVVVGA